MFRTIVQNWVSEEQFQRLLDVKRLCMHLTVFTSSLLCCLFVPVPDVSYPNIFVTGASYRTFLERCRVRYLGLRLGLVLKELCVGLELGVRVKVKIRL